MAPLGLPGFLYSMGILPPPRVSSRGWYCRIPLAHITPGLWCLSCLALGAVPLLWGRGAVISWQRL